MTREQLAVLIDPCLKGTVFNEHYTPGSRIGQALAAADRILAAVCLGAPHTGSDLKAALAFMDGAGALLGRGEMPAPGSDYAVEWCKAHAIVLQVLRSLTAADFTRPISGIADRSPHEVFDIMVSRIPQSLRGAP